MNLAQVNLFVEDFPTMLRFYRDHLGCEVLDIEPGPPAVPLVNWVSLVAGNMIIELFDATAYCRDLEQLRGTSRQATQLCFLVDDVAAELARLEGLGITCEPVITENWGSCSAFSDPEGNQLQIYQVFDRSSPATTSP